MTLIIETGVTVKFDPGLALQVNGALIARGSGDAPILFTSNAASPALGDWGHILFTDTSVDAVYNSTGDYLSGSILERCTIEFAGSGVDYALRLDHSGPFINHCTIKDNAGSGITVDAGFDASVSIKIMNSTVKRNSGSGISISGGLVTVSSNFVTGNTVAAEGAGIFIRSFSASSASLWGNIVSGNTATAGGGILIDNNNGPVTLSGNTITGNSSSNWGGGVYIGGGGGPNALSGNIIAGNSATRGGGVYIRSWGASLSDNTITGNIASDAGGGVYIFSGSFTLSDNTIARNTALGNGGAIYIDNGTVTLSSNTIIGNTSPSSAVYWQGLAGSASDNNLFENDTQYLVYNGNSNTQPDVNMENNWWGTTDTGDIATSIYDWFDDSTKGFVDYTPFLTQPNTGAPVSPPMGLAATGDGNPGFPRYA